MVCHFYNTCTYTFCKENFALKLSINKIYSWLSYIVICYINEIILFHPQKIETRLAGSRSNRGRLEVRLKGREEWGVVCGDHWTIKEAMVVCRDMNAGYGQQAIKVCCQWNRNFFLKVLMFNHWISRWLSFRWFHEPLTYVLTFPMNGKTLPLFMNLVAYQ